MHIVYAPQICVIGPKGEQRRFEFRREDMRLSGKLRSVLALRPIWAEVDPELAEFADLSESPVDRAISEQQARWFLQFIAEYGEENIISAADVPQVEAFRLIKFVETYFELAQA